MTTPSGTSDQNLKSRRPAESAFKQQRLPAWQPILTAETVWPAFMFLGIAFIPIGIGLLSCNAKEHVINYTDCMSSDYDPADPRSNQTCAQVLKQYPSSSCMCRVIFNLTEDFNGSVYFYYGLTNFYQNHRRYVKSRDDNQLLGRLSAPPSSDCEPFARDNRVPIAPCGAIANSLFNDTLSLYYRDKKLSVPVIKTGIAWESDKKFKFKNPPGNLSEAFANYTKPINWNKNVWELDPDDPTNNGFQNEDLIVWMRTADLPTFRKLYRRVDHADEKFAGGLSKGRYVLRIKYNYPVTEFKGTKSFIISTTSLLGGKNKFLGVAYIVTGMVCLVLGAVMLMMKYRIRFSRFVNR